MALAQKIVQYDKECNEIQKEFLCANEKNGHKMTWLFLLTWLAGLLEGRWLLLLVMMSAACTRGAIFLGVERQS